MNERNVAPGALSAGNGAHVEEGPGAAAARAARPHDARPASGWTGGRVAALVVGGLLVLLSLVVLGAGGTALWADRTQRVGGYATTGVHEFSTSGSALATERTHLGAAGIGWLYSPGLLGKVRIRVTPVGAGAPLFVGIGPSSDVDRYLAGVNHTLISDFFRDRVEAISGGKPPSPPGSEDFWATSASGRGPQTLVWDPANGSWTVVVMNADGRPGIHVAADLGAKLPPLLWIAIGLLLVGAVLLVGGALVVAGAIRRRRAGPPETEARAHGVATVGAPPSSSGGQITAADPEYERRSHAEH